MVLCRCLSIAPPAGTQVVAYYPEILRCIQAVSSVTVSQCRRILVFQFMSNSRCGAMNSNQASLKTSGLLEKAHDLVPILSLYHGSIVIAFRQFQIVHRPALFTQSGGQRARGFHGDELISGTMTEINRHG